MRRTRHSSKQPPATTDETEHVVTPIDEVWEKITSIEEEVHRRFEQIDEDLNTLKTNSEKNRKTESIDDESFLKLCHAVDYLLERSDHDYESLACREMILSLLGPKVNTPVLWTNDS